MLKRTITGLSICLSAHAQDRSQSRSMVMSQLGIVASESVLASQVGARILEQGGNAIDAAVAANAMMGLMAPMNCGVGGDLFALVYEAKSGKLYGLNASGWAPKGLTADYLLGKGITAMPQSGIDSVTVPGAVDGWDQLLKRFGRKTFADVLAPAIAIAKEGFPVDEIVSVYWRDSEKTLRADEATAKTYLVEGQAALDAPRFCKHTFPGCDVDLEARVPEATRKELTAMGHEIALRGDFSALSMGSGQAVARDFAKGVNAAASDPRKDGSAVAELRPFAATP